MSDTPPKATNWLKETNTISEGEYAAAQNAVLREIALACYRSTMAQRDEILKAFVAKYGCGPDELVQVEGTDPNGHRYWHVALEKDVWPEKEEAGK